MAKESQTKQELQKAPGRTLSPFDELDRLFGGDFSRRWMRPLSMEWPDWSSIASGFATGYPRVDVIDRDDEVVIRADVAGIKKEDLDVSVTGDSVTIKGSMGHETEAEQGEFFRREITRGAFSRTIALPGMVDEAKAKARFSNGILELTMPKAERAKRRSIKIE